MARKLRDDCLVSGHPNHIFTRGNNRRRLFSYPHERLTFLRLLGDRLEADCCTLHAFCLMTNHVHLLLTPSSIDAASNCMKLTLQRYAQLRNERRRSSGKLFEQRFESKPITSAAQLALTVMYIEANPHRAGMRNPFDYPWSSYAFHAGTDAHPKISRSLVDPDAWYLGLGKTRRDRLHEYRRSFADYLASKAEPEHGAAFTKLERASHRYRRRLRRPDDSSAA